MLPFWTPIFVLGQTNPLFSPGVHVVQSKGVQPAMVIKSSDTTIDLKGFELVGTSGSQQEKYAGIGLLLDHCKNVVIKNGKVHGYRINVLLRGCQNVRIEDMRADYSHADPIRTSGGQPIDHFLSLRKLDDWPTYGAGIWLHNCQRCHLVRCQAHHAMNGAVLVTSGNCTLYNCDFSYNSGWGVALWGSSANRVLWNHIDFCNRPWSGGWGGDAANLTLVSGSNDNVVVGNSLTHGGDGLFLADRVEGGWDDATKKFNFQDNSNGNFFWNNDGSWASANAFEATFSHDNQFGENLANDSNYGFWLGYSSTSTITSNHINGNDHDGIAIEHGQANRILSNFLDSNTEAGVHLWSSTGPKDVDKPSKDNVVAYNKIDNCGTPLDVKSSANTTLLDNKLNGAAATSTSEVIAPNWPTPKSVTDALALKPSRWKSYRDSGGPAGQAWIQAGVYAPIPFINYGSAFVNSTTYKLWFLNPPTDLTGPSWVTFKPGHDPHYVTATIAPTQDEGADESAILRFSSATVANPDPLAPSIRKRPQMVLKFRTGSWDCKWFSWKKIGYDDRQAWIYLFNSQPLTETTLPALNADYNAKSPVPNLVPVDHFALLATRKFRFTSGIYRFSTVSDDGIRLFVDGREIITRWNHHGGTADTVDVPVTAGTHDLRVEYCQEDGDAQIRVDWSKVRDTKS